MEIRGVLSTPLLPLLPSPFWLGVAVPVRVPSIGWINFHAAVVSILLYGCTTWTLTKCMEKKLDGNYARMLWAVLSKSWRQHPTKQQLYGHLSPISKTIQVRRTRHVGHCWRSRDELISDILLWTPSHGWAKLGRPASTYIQQLCADTGCSFEDLLEVMVLEKGDGRGSGRSMQMVPHDDDKICLKIISIICINNSNLNVKLFTEDYY